MHGSIWIPGAVPPKGSAVGFPHRTTGRVIVRQQNASALEAWCKSLDEMWGRVFAGRTFPLCDDPGFPFHLLLDFWVPRPQRCKRDLPTVRPDLDKLERAVLDALTGLLYVDDAQVTYVTKKKRYIPFSHSKLGKPGVLISWREDTGD